MGRHRFAFLALALLASTGCETVSYKSNLPPNGPTHEEHADFFLCGLAGEKTVDLDALCPQGVARWSNQASVPDVLLSIITFAIYTPRTIHVDCSRGLSWELTTDPSTGKLASIKSVPGPGLDAVGGPPGSAAP
jgi:hypothetical protein